MNPIDESTPPFPYDNDPLEKDREEDTLASRVYRVAEVLQVPLYVLCNTILARLKTVLTPGEFGNYDNTTFEIIRRVFLGCLIPPVATLTLIGSVSAVVLDFIGDVLLGNHPYLRLLGTYHQEKKESFGTFNMSTLLPTMTLSDGVSYSHERLKGIADKLESFHFVCGQEVDGPSARFFAHELKHHFAEFYTYLGKANTPFLPSGLFFASKEKVLNVTVIPFTGAVQKTIRRELVIFELGEFCVATMHLDGGDGEKVTQIHLQEIEQAKAALAQCKKPVILCGDFNEDRYVASVAYQALTENFVDCIGEQTKGVITCTDALKIARFGETKTPTEESIDYITYNRNQTQLQLEFLGVDHSFDLSDHGLVKGRIVFS